MRAMALGTGLREHELVALDMGDVFDAHGKARRRIALRVFKGADRDSDVAQDLLVPEGLRVELTKLWTWKVREGESIEADAPIFVSRWVSGCRCGRCGTVFGCGRSGPGSSGA